MNLLRTARAIVVITVSSAFLSHASDVTDARTYVLVRHAERSTTDGDTPLSEAGRTRSRILADLLRDVNLQSIYVSQMIRTKETAEPIARLKGLQPESISTTEMDSLVEKLRKTPSGASVLVVHHSGTLPRIIEKLGASSSPIPENEFDRLYVVTLPATGKPSVLMLRYGAK
jgi:broad specificity phosphatase PhoE